jgi:hypothetical protein
MLLRSSPLHLLSGDVVRPGALDHLAHDARHAATVERALYARDAEVASATFFPPRPPRGARELAKGGRGQPGLARGAAWVAAWVVGEDACRVDTDGYGQRCCANTIRFVASRVDLEPTAAAAHPRAAREEAGPRVAYHGVTLPPVMAQPRHCARLAAPERGERLRYEPTYGSAEGSLCAANMLSTSRVQVEVARASTRICSLHVALGEGLG